MGHKPLTPEKMTMSQSKLSNPSPLAILQAKMSYFRKLVVFTFFPYTPRSPRRRERNLVACKRKEPACSLDQALSL